MNSVILFLVFVSGFVIALLPGVAIVIYAGSSKRNRFKTYQRLTRSLQAEKGQGIFIPVRYASPERFAKLVKFFPWELCGIIRIEGQQVSFHTSFSGWDNLCLNFESTTAEVSWLGRSFLRNGALTWVVISQAGKKHYFSSETGIAIFGSKSSTRELYESLSRCLESFPKNKS